MIASAKLDFHLASCQFSANWPYVIGANAGANAGANGRCAVFVLALHSFQASVSLPVSSLVHFYAKIGEEKMKKLTFAMMFIFSCAAQAQTAGLKPGLWETKVVHQVVDGRDMTAQIAAAQAQMQAAMAKMTPEQRQQMGSMARGMPGQGGNIRMCISAAMAARYFTQRDPSGHCPSATATTSGNKTTFSFNCTNNGRTAVGNGESIVNGDTVSSHMEIDSADTKGHHTMQMDTTMTYLGSDCQGVTPIDELAKGAQAPGH
jgi:hypothetical protein